MKLSPEERRKVILHNRVAPPIPQLRQVKSLRGQLQIDFEKAGQAVQQQPCSVSATGQAAPNKLKS